MTPGSCIAAPSAAPAVASVRREYLSDRAAFFLQASITLSFLAGSSAPTPLYTIYQAAWGFSSAAITFVFGVYALAVLAALLVAGRLSDHVGRRPVLIASSLAQAVAMIALATADGLGGLVAGRVIQGLATGAAVAAVGAGLIDLDRARGTVANAIAPIMGTATGALVAGLMVHYLPAPTHLVYAFLAVVFIAQGLLVVSMRESVTPKAGALASLRPQFALPPATRKPMLQAIPMLVAVWALGGFYGALAPALLHRVFDLDPSLFGGFALFTLAGAGAAAILGLQDRDAHALKAIGGRSLIVGTAVILTSVALASVPLFFVGTAIAGAGFGTGFQGAIRTVVSRAEVHERAGVLSIAFVVSYLAMGCPAVLAGFVVSHGGSLVGTTQVFGVALLVLAGLALLGRRSTS